MEKINHISSEVIITLAISKCIAMGYWIFIFVYNFVPRIVKMEKIRLFINNLIFFEPSANFESSGKSISKNC